MKRSVTGGAIWLGVAAIGCDTARAQAPAEMAEKAAPSVAVAASGSVPVRAAGSAPAPKPLPPAPPAPPALVDGCPPEMARVGAACVDMWEAHLVVIEASGSAAPHSHVKRPEKGTRYRAVSAPDVFPQAYISKHEAHAACVEADKRLCTLGEWYRACRTKSGHVYPYGAAAVKGKCNTGKAHLLSQLFGRDARRWKFSEHFNSPELNLTPGFLEKTGERGECTSEHGTFDMVGNLHEWISDIVDDALPKKIPLRDDIREKLVYNQGHSIFMGGFFSTTNEHGEGCAFLTPGHGAKYHDYSTGFRCCKAAEQ